LFSTGAGTLYMEEEENTVKKPQPSSEVAVWSNNADTIMIQVFTPDAMSIIEEARKYGRVYVESGIHFLYVHKVFNATEVFTYLHDLAETYKITKTDDGDE